MQLYKEGKEEGNKGEKDKGKRESGGGRPCVSKQKKGDISPASVEWKFCSGFYATVPVANELIRSL